MRLLNTRTKELKTFIGAGRPAYAILSHTWGTGEVEFNDVNAPKWTEKRGYAKIEFTCRQAVEEDPPLEWCWIDTLCINKDSSSELSEAINSMFRWYSEAAVCYAYLDDVDSENVITSLHKARWFTRGWTLQELMAPKRVDFFDENWTKLGTKDTESHEIGEFIDILANVTEIDPLVLWKPAYRRTKSIATRMSWASKRETTRQEDLAYCLMGLFDVSMPLLYGEGTRAFIRLQEEIIKISDDHSIFAWDRDLDGATASSCFAHSPSLFRRGTLVLAFGRDQTANIPYSVTNQGLQITLPIYKNPDTDMVHGLLNCHWANTLTDCIGIPLLPTSTVDVFERSPMHDPEAVALNAMTDTETRTVFLISRNREEMAFAAEVSLQLYDSTLVEEHGFSLVEVVEPPNSSYHWHPEYYTFRMRWVASSDSGSIEKPVRLMWRHDELDHNGLVLDFSCTMVYHAGSVKSFRVRRLWFSSGTPTGGNSQVEDYTADALTAETSIKNLQAEGGSPIFVTAKLEKRSVFGNEVYTLSMNIRDTSIYNN